MRHVRGEGGGVEEGFLWIVTGLGGLSQGILIWAVRWLSPHSCKGLEIIPYKTDAFAYPYSVPISRHLLCDGQLATILQITDATRALRPFTFTAQIEAVYDHLHSM